MLMPIDPEGGGSWIALSEEGRAASLLNGAREAHESLPPYAKSRGLLLRESFEWEDPERFASEVPLTDIGPEALSIEPFTLVLLQVRPKPSITVLLWDGEERELKSPDPQVPHVLSAPKLYPPQVIRETEKRFQAFLERRKGLPSKEDLEDLIEGEHYRLKLERAGLSPLEGLDTLSTTSLRIGKERAEMDLYDRMERIEGRTALFF